MSRADVEADIRETLGLVPEFFAEVPDTLIEMEWASFKGLMLSETVQGADRSRSIGRNPLPLLRLYHTEAARLWGATDEDINEAALVAKNTMGWSTYLNTRAFDYDRFEKKFRHTGGGDERRELLARRRDREDVLARAFDLHRRYSGVT